MNSKPIKHQTKHIYRVSMLVFIATVAWSCCETLFDERQDSVSATLQSGNPWKINTVTIGGVDRTQLYQDMTLIFTRDAYTTTNSQANAWASSGTWKFNNIAGTELLREDNVKITILPVDNEELTGKQLKLKFDVPDQVVSGGRSAEILPSIFDFRK